MLSLFAGGEAASGRHPLTLVRGGSALGDRLRVVEVPGSHMVQWDAFDEVADAVEPL